MVGARVPSNGENKEKKLRAAGAVFETDCQYWDRLNKITGTIKTDPYIRSFQSVTRETALISEHQTRNYWVSLWARLSNRCHRGKGKVFFAVCKATLKIWYSWRLHSPIAEPLVCDRVVKPLIFLHHRARISIFASRMKGKRAAKMFILCFGYSWTIWGGVCWRD